MPPGWWNWQTRKIEGLVATINGRAGSSPAPGIRKRPKGRFFFMENIMSCNLKQKKLRIANTILLIILILMMMIGWNIDFSKSPIFFLTYYSISLLIILIIFILTIFDVLEIKKMLIEQIKNDEKSIKEIVQDEIDKTKI